MVISIQDLPLGLGKKGAFLTIKRSTPPKLKYKMKINICAEQIKVGWSFNQT